MDTALLSQLAFQGICGGHAGKLKLLYSYSDFWGQSVRSCCIHSLAFFTSTESASRNKTPDIAASVVNGLCVFERNLSRHPQSDRVTERLNKDHLYRNLAFEQAA